MSDSENGKGETTQPDVQEDSEDKKEPTDSKQEEKPANEEKKSKKPVKKEEVKEQEEEEDVSDESEEEEVGLLDRPVEVSGSRERKKVERLELNFKTPSKDKPEIPEGKGEKLGECPRIEFKVQKTPVEELKALHKVLFNRPGSANEIKRNIRKFCGFSFSEGSAEYEKKKSTLEKTKMGVLKHICEVLDIERSGLREEVALRILQFLLEPKSSGKAMPVSKSKKKSSTKGGKAKRTEKSEKEKGSKKGSAKRKKKASDSDDEGSDESLEKEEDDEEQDDVADESDDSYEKPKKQKKGKPKKKKEVPAKEKKKEKNGEKSRKSEDKRPPAKSTKRKSVGSSEDSDESSDGEPLAKKVKSPPSDEEIKQLVKKILDDADLEEITMKKVIKQVFDAYPDFDLSEKKDYIKATVKSVIS